MRTVNLLGGYIQVCVCVCVYTGQSCQVFAIKHDCPMVNNKLTSRYLITLCYHQLVQNSKLVLFVFSARTILCKRFMMAIRTGDYISLVFFVSKISPIWLYLIEICFTQCYSSVDSGGLFGNAQAAFCHVRLKYFRSFFIQTHLQLISGTLRSLDW